MPGIPHPVHEAEGGFGEQAVASVIFEENKTSSYTGRLFEQRNRIGSVVDYIHKHHDVESFVGKGNVDSIENFYGDMGIFSNENVDPDDFDFRSELGHSFAQITVTGAYIQHLGLRVQ